MTEGDMAKSRVKKTTAAIEIVENVVAQAAPPQRGGKVGLLVDLMRRPEGAEIEEMMAATGWQAHSVRGAISGSVKKALGLTVTSVKEVDVRVYRIAPEVGA
jgi:hypothetical protein